MNSRVIFMSENMTEKKETGILKNPESSKQQIFDSDQNLVGLFSILLQVDKRKRPHNYKYVNGDINL